MSKRSVVVSTRVEEQQALDLNLVAFITESSLAATTRQALDEFVAGHVLDNSAIAAPEQRDWHQQAETAKPTAITTVVDTHVSQQIKQIAWRSGVSTAVIVRHAFAQYVRKIAIDEEALDNAARRLTQQLIAIERLRSQIPSSATA